MKKIFLIVLLFAMSACAIGQPLTRHLPVVENDYLKKSRQQKTAAWLMLGGGMILGAGGYVLFIYEGLQGDGVGSTKFKAGVVMFYAGGLSMLGSIPLFIAGARNKGIGMSLSINNKYAPQIQKGNIAYRTVPSLTLKIHL